MFVIMKQIFAELGRLYRYQSGSDFLHLVPLWRASDLLVWNSADKQSKTKQIVTSVVDTNNTLFSNGYRASKHW